MTSMALRCLSVRMLAIVFAAASLSRAEDEPPPDAEKLERAEQIDEDVIELCRAGKLAEAESLAREGLRLREEALGPDHPDVATNLIYLATILKHRSRYDAARPLCERALAIREKAFGADDAGVAAILDQLAEILDSQGQYEAARPLYERAIAIYEKAPGRDSIDLAESLNHLAGNLKAQGEYQLARTRYERALAIQEKALEPDDPDVAWTLNELAVVLEDLDQYDAARPLFERALAIREKVLGQDHPDVALSLNNLAGLLAIQGEYEAARTLCQRGLEIYTKALGPGHPDVAWNLSKLAGIHAAEGHNDAARPLYERALHIYEKALGPDDPEVASSLNDLALLLRSQGLYDEAKPLYERALAIREKTLGPDHPDVAVSLNNLALLLYLQGRYEAARPLHERALAIREKVLGVEDPAVALSLNNLAALLLAQGQYEAARPLFERALAIREKVNDPDDPEVARGLNNLAAVFRCQCQYEAARPLYERAVALWEKARGPDHPEVATSLNNLAGVLDAQGLYEAARPLYERALAIREKALGPDHPEVAQSINNVAMLLCDRGQYEAARPLHERALAIREKALGPDHPDVAGSLINLASLLEAQGQYEAARLLYERGLAIQEKALGPEHPALALSLKNLAELLELQARHEAARPLYERALAIIETNLRRGLSGLHSSERLESAKSARFYLERWLLACPRFGRSGYEEVLRLRGFVTRAEAAERALLRAGGEKARARQEEILALDRQLGGLSARCPREPVAREAWRKQCAELAAKREGLLLAMARDLKPLREAMERLDLKTGDIRARLGEGEVLVDFLRYGDGYLAFVVPARGDPARVELAKTQQIEEAAEAFVAAVASGEPEADAAKRATVLLFDPVRARLPQGTKRIFLCPDSALAAVPFAALPGLEPGTALIDEFEIVHVEMAQDLVPPASPCKPGAGVLIVGGVDYGKAEVSPSPAPSPLLMAVDRAPHGGRWGALPATEGEAALLAKRLGEDAVVLSGGLATESRVRSLSRGKAILHLATHGYVLEDRLARVLQQQEQAQNLDAMLERQLAVGADPMLLSGIVFAGANSGDGADGDDGLLTAAEVSWLDLEGVQLAVLSACQTGRGTPAAGEGTLGLVRGFRLAGAERVIASLWKVDDDATALLMERFYEGYLDRKLDPAAALRGAAIAVRDFRNSQGKQPFAAPRYWAAFVAFGR